MTDYAEIQMRITNTELPKKTKNTQFKKPYEQLERKYKELIKSSKKHYPLGTDMEGVAASLEELLLEYQGLEKSYLETAGPSIIAETQLAVAEGRYRQLKVELNDSMRTFIKTSPMTKPARDVEGLKQKKEFEENIPKSFSYIERMEHVRNYFLQQNKILEKTITRINDSHHSQMQNMHVQDSHAQVVQERIEQQRAEQEEAAQEQAEKEKAVDKRKEAAALEKNIDLIVKTMQATISKEQYSDVHDKISNIEMPLAIEGNKNSFQDVVNYIAALKKVETQLKEINAEHIQNKIEIDAIKNAQTLQSFLNTPNLSSSKASYVLDKLAFKKVIKYFDKIPELEPPAIEHLRNFIKKHEGTAPNNKHFSSLIEKLTYYDILTSLNIKEAWKVAIDPNFRIAFSFLKNNKQMGDTAAAELASNKENRELILAIKEIDAPTLSDDTREEANSKTGRVDKYEPLKPIEGQTLVEICQSPIKIQAAQAILSSPAIKRYHNIKNEIRLELLNAIAKDENLAQVIVNMKDKKEFIPVFLLGLASNPTLVDNLLKNDKRESYQQVLAFLMTDKSRILQDTFDVESLKQNCANMVKNLRDDNIRLLEKTFKEVNNLFDGFKNTTSDQGDPLNRKLENTKNLIFTELTKGSWEEGTKKADKIIKEEFKDNRDLLQKLSDGLSAIWSTLTSWASKSPIEPIKNNPYYSKELSHKFKEKIKTIKEEDSSPPDLTDSGPQS
jgi:hypothetical protein